MLSTSRKKITSALQTIQHEVAVEINKTIRIKALLREYFSDHIQHDTSDKGKKRRGHIEGELRRFAEHL
jgi:hypothetical protein